jgi:hypothetical protein
MPSEPVNIRHLLVERLESLGVAASLVPGLLRLISSAVAAEPHPNREIVSRRMKFLGWSDFELDEHTFQLAMACLDEEACKSTADLIRELENQPSPSE